jgi:hypothetical protein
MCRWMAEGVDATAPLVSDPTNEEATLPMVTVLKCPPPDAEIEEWDAIVEVARHMLSLGLAVAVVGDAETGPKRKWDKRSLCDVASCNADGAQIQWQCIVSCYPLNEI